MVCVAIRRAIKASMQTAIEREEVPTQAPGNSKNMYKMTAVEAIVPSLTSVPRATRRVRPDLIRRPWMNLLYPIAAGQGSNIHRAP